MTMNILLNSERGWVTSGHLLPDKFATILRLMKCFTIMRTYKVAPARPIKKRSKFHLYQL